MEELERGGAGGMRQSGEHGRAVDVSVEENTGSGEGR